MSPLTYSILYWTCAYIALLIYWLPSSKACERSRSNMLMSAALVTLGLVLGLFIEGTDPGGMGIAYSINLGLAGGTTVKTIAEARSAGR